jgi:predicted nucleotidyltransferase component of viral defense system
MIIEELKNIVFKSKQKNLSNLYIKSLLKEYLQVYVLNFVYLNPTYGKQLIFTGGTCLRHCYDLSRDFQKILDFDIENEIDVEKFQRRFRKVF